jgi:galactose-1-phosphate uridylyltransferase
MGHHRPERATGRAKSSRNQTASGAGVGSIPRAFLSRQRGAAAGIIAEMPSNQKPGWRTRVVPNKFPAVGQDVSPHKQEPAFYETAAGRGKHEVVIESPRHDHDITTMPEEQARDALATCRNRYEALTADNAGSVVSSATAGQSRVRHCRIRTRN